MGKAAPDLKKAQADLLQGLWDAAKTLLDPQPAEIKPAGVQDIENILKTVTEGRFYDKFGYKFKGDASAPPKFDTAGKLVGLEDFLLNPNGDKATAKNWVDQAILKSTTLPSWAADQAQSDLEDLVANILNNDTEISWFNQSFNRTYTHTDDSGKTHQMTGDAMLTYTNAKITEPDGAKAADNIIYFVGTYYNSKGGWD